MAREADSLRKTPPTLQDAPEAVKGEFNSGAAWKNALEKVKAENPKKVGLPLRSAYDVSVQELLETSHRDLSPRDSTLFRPRASLDSLGCKPPDVVDAQKDWFMVHPEDPKRVAWNVAACGLLLYSVIVTPLQLFEPEPDAFLTFMEWVNILYWTTDMPVSFVTGYFCKVGSHTEMRFREVARRYSMTWFPFDICIVCMEWSMMIMDLVTSADSANSVGLARTLRAARILRMARYLRLIRLVRLLKLGSLMETLREKANSDWHLMFLTLCKWMGIIAFLAHTSCCIWYAVGNTNGGWVYEAGLNSQDLNEKYFMSFEWSLSRLHPTNLNRLTELHSAGEKIFSVMATFAALAIGSLFVSLITNKMAEVKRQSNAKDLKLDLVRAYSLKFNISTRLTLRMKRHISTSWMAQLRAEEEAELMRVLPPSVLTELRFQTWSPIICDHPFFGLIHRDFERVEIAICSRVIAENMCFKDSDVFSRGEECLHALIPLSGQHVYTYSCGFNASTGTSASGLERVNVAFRQCLCEATLWTPWHYLGDLTTTMTGSMASIDANELSKVLLESPESLVATLQYARDFLERLSIDTDRFTDLPLSLGTVSRLCNHRASASMLRSSAVSPAPSDGSPRAAAARGGRASWR